MSLPTASSVSSPGGKGAETSLLYLPVSAYSVESGQGQESTASRTRAASDFGFLFDFGSFFVAVAELDLDLDLEGLFFPSFLSFFFSLDSAEAE